jgi:hypothetical protein
VRADDNDTRDLLIEAMTSAFRERDASGRIVPSPAWRDLAPEDREAAFESQIAARHLERTLDPDGLSTTARAVLWRAWGLAQLGRGEQG